MVPSERKLSLSLRRGGGGCGGCFIQLERSRPSDADAESEWDGLLGSPLAVDVRRSEAVDSVGIERGERDGAAHVGERHAIGEGGASAVGSVAVVAPTATTLAGLHVEASERARCTTTAAGEGEESAMEQRGGHQQHSPVLAEADLEVRVLRVGLHAFNSLDLRRRQQVGSATFGKGWSASTYRVGDVGEVDEAALLLAQSVHKLDLAVLAKVLAKLLLRVDVKVLNVADLGREWESATVWLDDVKRARLT